MCFVIQNEIFYRLSSYHGYSWDVRDLDAMVNLGFKRFIRVYRV